MKILNFGLFLILIGLNQLKCSSQEDNRSLYLASTSFVLKNSSQDKTIDMLYPVIKNNEGSNKLAQLLDGLNVNQPFSNNVVEAFQAGEDVPGLTVLQLAVLFDRLEMVDYLLSLKNININQETKRKTVRDYCEFYNIAPIIDLNTAIRPKIREKLISLNAVYGKDMREYLKERHLFTVKLKRLEI